MKLPLDVGIKINISDPVVTFKEVMEGVNLNKYLIKNSTETRGRDGYDPKVLLKIVLFAFMINVRSTRKIESLCRNDIRFMYLSDEITPSHMTICNFINDYLIDSIENISNDIVSYIIKKQNIDISTIFIDGTKIEAFPNKYTWVWKNACITSRNRQFKKISSLFNQINNSFILNPDTMFEIKESYSIEELEQYLSILISLSEEKNISFVYRKGKRKDIIQKYYDQLNSIVSLLKDYAIKIDKCGEHRNSYSKTDVDATFMRMKTDYMGNTALLPAYNWQLVSAGELILFGLTSQSASDNKCFIPLMNKYKSLFGTYPKTPVDVPSLIGLVYSRKKVEGKYNTTSIIVITCIVSILTQLAFGIFILCLNSRYLIKDSALSIILAECGVIMLICSILIHPMINSNTNLLFGIRTKFSLESKDNWYKMNRFGSYSLVVGSLSAIILTVFISIELFYISLLPYLLATIMIFIYEYILKRKQNI